VGARALIAAAMAALLAGCAGPRAKATDARVRPSMRAGYQRVEVVLVNGAGRGQVAVTARLRNTATGRIVTKTQAVDVDPHDRTDVAMEVPAPPGDYAVSVSVDYPPR